MASTAASALPGSAGAFGEFFKKATERASDVLQNFGIVSPNKFSGKDGDVIYSKNNVCIHPPNENEEVGQEHVPGYMSIHCQDDECLGITLILQWIPNVTLERNPKSIRTMSAYVSPFPASPATTTDAGARVKLRHLQEDGRAAKQRGMFGSDTRTSSSSSGDQIFDPTTDSQSVTTPASECDDDCTTSGTDSVAVTREPRLSVEMSVSGEQLRVLSVDENNVANRPSTLDTPTANGQGCGLGIPAINLIPHTPVTPVKTDPAVADEASPETSDADEEEAEDERRPKGKVTDGGESSPYSSAAESEPETPTNETSSISSLLESFQTGMAGLESTPEQFAVEHNLMLPDGFGKAADAEEKAQQQNHKGPSLFSVDLGHMRSLRLFYSDDTATSGQLVVATPDSRYKILHFHHGGLNKLAQIFQQWNGSRLKNAAKRPMDSPLDISVSGHQFAICRPEVTKVELHPEEGLYDTVVLERWRSHVNAQGAIEDDLNLRKAIFFGGLEKQLRREAWPFLLGVYAWNSTSEQRESMRNQLFLEYQSVRKKRHHQSLVQRERLKSGGSIDGAVSKDVVRTDRVNPFYMGDDNPNIETMKTILLNYATFVPSVGYVQGMSDLLAPILVEIDSEADAFWCFAGLMQRTIFVSAGKRANNIDRHLVYLIQLIKILYPEFYAHLERIARPNGPSGPLRNPQVFQLLFAHRWILLCFKREFPEAAALRIWEACWACVQTPFFHLFVALAIIMTYGADALHQALPHDELLLYFSSLAMHMDVQTVLRKARGLLHRLVRLPTIPCSLAELLAQPTVEDVWEGGQAPLLECDQSHSPGELCAADKLS